MVSREKQALMLANVWILRLAIDARSAEYSAPGTSPVRAVLEGIRPGIPALEDELGRDPLAGDAFREASRFQKASLLRDTLTQVVPSSHEAFRQVVLPTLARAVALGAVDAALTAVLGKSPLPVLQPSLPGELWRLPPSGEGLVHREPGEIEEVLFRTLARLAETPPVEPPQIRAALLAMIQRAYRIGFTIPTRELTEES